MSRLINCSCNPDDRKESEAQREWLKRILCMYHWMQTDYYRAKGHKFIDNVCTECGLEEAIALSRGECKK